MSEINYDLHTEMMNPINISPEKSPPNNYPFDFKEDNG